MFNSFLQSLTVDNDRLKKSEKKLLKENVHRTRKCKVNLRLSYVFVMSPFVYYYALYTRRLSKRETGPRIG